MRAHVVSFVSQVYRLSSNPAARPIGAPYCTPRLIRNFLSRCNGLRAFAISIPLGPADDRDHSVTNLRWAGMIVQGLPSSIEVVALTLRLRVEAAREQRTLFKQVSWRKIFSHLSAVQAHALIVSVEDGRRGTSISLGSRCWDHVKQRATHFDRVHGAYLVF